MSGNDDDTEEPRDDSPAGGGGSAPSPKGSRLSFGKLGRELTKAELNTSGVQKMLLDELYRREGVEHELAKISDRYHAANTSLAVSMEKLKTHNAFDIISTGTTAIGTLLFGAAFSVKGNDILFWLLVVISLILVLVGIVAKVTRA